MTIKQISVFLDNRPGRILDLATALEKGGINIHALYVADTSEYGILRMIVSKPLEAEKTLKEAGFTARLTDVIAISMTDSPGGLRRALEPFRDSDVSIEYIYAFTGRNEKNDAAVVLKVSDPQKTEEILKNADIHLISQEDVTHL